MGQVLKDKLGAWMDMRRVDECSRAILLPETPVNPRPFALALAELVRNEGTDSIRTKKGKRILWVLLAQAYGDSAAVDIEREWSILSKGIR